MPQLDGEPLETPSAPDLTGATVGRFVIRRRLGQGGMGQVYMADDTLLSRQVAIKRVAPHLAGDNEARVRLLHEARLAATLEHPHVARIYDAFEDHGEVFVVMELVAGESLRARLRRGPLPAGDVVRLAREITEAVNAAHIAGIVHGDLKPDNILIDARGAVKVCDFGLARRLRESATDAPTGEGSFASALLAGTPAYMAPESLLQGRVTARSDIFSLGVVLHEALTGHQPFEASNIVAIAERVIHEPLPPLDQTTVPPALDALIARMTAKRDDERPSSLREVLAELDGLDTVSAPRASGATVRPAVVFAVAVLALGLTIAVAVPVWQAWNRVPIPVLRNLVVLPFDALGDEAITPGFVAGLVDTVNARMTRFTQDGGLQVVPPEEVASRKVRQPDDARREFGATLVLSGTIQRAGPRLRVNVFLTDTQSRQRLRAESLTVEAGDPFALQDLVVARAAAMLELEAAAAPEPAARSHGTTHADAYDYYLQGRGYLREYDRPENVDSAISLFERSLVADARFAAAHAGLGDAYWKKFDITKDTQWVTRARASCEHAVELAPALSTARGCLATVLSGTGEYERAVVEFEQALGQEPTNDLLYAGLASTYERMRRLDDAERVYQQAIDARRHYWAGYSALGVFYFRLGRYQEAIAMFQQVVALAPDNARGYSNLGGAHFRNGDLDAARAALERSMTIRPSYAAASNLGTLYYNEGDFARAAATFQTALDLNATDHRLWGNLASALHWAGRPDRSRQIYAKALELAEKRYEVNPKDVTVMLSIVDYAAALGDLTRARSLLDRAQALAPDDGAVQFRAAHFFEYHLRDRDQALIFLERAVRLGYSWLEIERNPAFRALRADQRFPALAALRSQPQAAHQ